MTNTLLSVAIVGAGRISWQLEKDPLRYKPCTHIGAICALISQGKQLSIDAIADPKKDRAEEAAAFIQKKICQTPGQINDEAAKLISETPDILVLAQSTPSHTKYLLAAMDAEVPSIIVEKPVCVREEESSVLRAQYKKSKSKIWVNYERRYHDRYLKLKSWLQEEKFGKAIRYQGFFAAPNANLFPKGDDEGVLLHDTTHLLDLVLYLFGKPSSSNSTHENDVHKLDLKHEGISGHLTTLVKSKFFHFELQVLCTHGRITASNEGLFIERVEKSKHYSNFTSLSKPEKVTEAKPSTENNPMVRLYNEVLNGEQPEMFTDALDNVVLLQS